MPEDLSPFNLKGISTADKETLTIGTTNGDITPAKQFVIVAAFSGTTDNRDRIITSSVLSPGDADGAVIYLMADAGDTITIRHNQGSGQTYNILTETGSSVTLTGNSVVRLIYNIALDTNGAWVVTAKYTDAEALSAAPAVTLAGTPDYITISGQVITRAKIDLTSSSIVDGILPEANLPNASETAEGVVERATLTEVNAGTDETRYIAPDELAGSRFGVKGFQVEVFATGVTQTTGVKKKINHIFPDMDGMELFYAHAEQTTPGEVSSLLTIDINKNGTSMLATLLTCDIGETGSDTAAAAVAFKTDGTEDVVTNDVISGDIDGVHGTAGVGLLLTIGFRLK